MAITENDFIDGPSADFGVTVTRTPVTTSIHNITGEKIYVDASTNTLTGVFENTNQKYSFDKAGLTKGADARMFIKGTATLNKNDKILHNSKNYRVDTMSQRLFASNVIFKTILLFEI